MQKERECERPSYQDPPALPPPGFDPVSNERDAARLAEFWLPDRPNRVTEPDLYEHWAEMMRAPLHFVLAGDGDTHHLEIPRFRSALTLPFASGGTHVGESRNWSGALVLPHTGGRFTRVAGKWVVPHVADGADPNPDGLEQGSTMWIGLDGAFPWSLGMPQVGSAHYIDLAGNPQYHLWFQWWLRDGASSEEPITGVAIHPDDEIYANLSVLSATTVRVSVANRTTKTFTTKQFTFDPATGGAPVLGASAQWILERPANKLAATAADPNGPLYPLPDYGSVTVSRCATRMDNGVPPGWVPRLLRMGEVMPVAPHLDLESVAVVRGQARRSFRLDYKRPI